MVWSVGGYQRLQRPVEIGQRPTCGHSGSILSLYGGVQKDWAIHQS